MPAFVKPLRLLVLAETPAWAELLRETLQALDQPTTLLGAASWAAAADLLEMAPVDVLLATPGCLPPSGESAMPLLLLLDDEPEGVPPGVSDWLVRNGLSDDMVRRSLRHVAEQARFRDTLQHLAVQDPLTGIPNRQGFHALLAARLAEGAQDDLTLGHLDLDNFRRVNDSLGHQAGDRLMRHVVARLQGQLQAGDHLARLGSDEFALLLDTRRDRGRAVRLAEAITQALAEPYWLDGESLLLGCSLGLARSRPRLGADPLMWHAHTAMQQAKRRDGCTFHCYDEAEDRGTRSLAEQECALRRALRRDELELHYQPRLCLSSGRIVGVEALVRWQHPDRGLLAPSEFVPLAEDSGLILPLGYWVISRALRDMQWLLGRGVPPLHMAINLSFRQFQDSQLLATLQRLISERGVDARWLEFELTETAVMRRSEQVQQTMAALAGLGVRFALDDFGTGFSSFVHLHSLPIALLKIDKSFVADMQVRAENRRLVEAMINLGHNLHLTVVAEGVENPEQLELLRQFGCDQVQGYLISKALPLAELGRFLVFGSRQLLLSDSPRP